MTIPGISAMTASAMVAAIGKGATFERVGTSRLGSVCSRTIITGGRNARCDLY